MRDALTAGLFDWETMITLFLPSMALAQSQSRVSLDSVSAIDVFRGNGTTGNPDESIDISSVIRLADNWSVHVRPWFFKSSASGATWSKEIYQAALRYQRPGVTHCRARLPFIQR